MAATLSASTKTSHPAREASSSAGVLRSQSPGSANASSRPTPSASQAPRIADRTVIKASTCAGPHAQLTSLAADAASADWRARSESSPCLVLFRLMRKSRKSSLASCTRSSARAASSSAKAKTAALVGPRVSCDITRSADWRDSAVAVAMARRSLATACTVRSMTKVAQQMKLTAPKALSAVDMATASHSRACPALPENPVGKSWPDAMTSPNVPKLAGQPSVAVASATSIAPVAKPRTIGRKVASATTALAARLLDASSASSSSASSVTAISLQRECAAQTLTKAAVELASRMPKSTIWCAMLPASTVRPMNKSGARTCKMANARSAPSSWR
mmetsp:Transcript_8534/g.33754  ORF Transcript_8534/g.33754 Transcript_8534/m.33754 type:complete len:333 (-) Transcript_8534:690-1688(-)